MTGDEAAGGLARDYAPPGEDRPLAGYLGLMTVYGTLVGGLTLAARRRERRERRGMGGDVPREVRWSDLAMGALAVHKVSRTITKDSVTSPLRAPFVRYVEPAGEGEVNEEVRVEGPLHAVGELLTCPLCVDVWVATLYIGGLVLAPRFTRAAASVFATTTASNAVHIGWDALKAASA